MSAPFLDQYGRISTPKVVQAELDAALKGLPDIDFSFVPVVEPDQIAKFVKVVGGDVAFEGRLRAIAKSRKRKDREEYEIQRRSVRRWQHTMDANKADRKRKGIPGVNVSGGFVSRKKKRSAEEIIAEVRLLPYEYRRNFDVSGAFDVFFPDIASTVHNDMLDEYQALIADRSLIEILSDNLDPMVGS